MAQMIVRLAADRRSNDDYRDRRDHRPRDDTRDDGARRSHQGSRRDEERDSRVGSTRRDDATSRSDRDSRSHADQKASNGAPEDVYQEEDVDEDAMAAMMGFGGFGTTKVSRLCSLPANASADRTASRHTGKTH